MSTGARAQLLESPPGMRAPALPRQRAWVGIAVYAIVFAALQIFIVDTHFGMAKLFHNVGMFPFNVAAAYWLYRASRNRSLGEREQRGLLILSAMYVPTMLRHAYLTVGPHVFDANAFWDAGHPFDLASYLLFIVGISQYRTDTRVQIGFTNLVLDIVSVVLATSACIWTFVVSPLKWSDWDGMRDWPSVTYPILCVIIFGLLARLFMRHPEIAQRSDLRLLLSAFFAQTSLDLMLSMTPDSAPFDGPFIAGIVYPSTYVLLIVAAQQTVFHRGTATPDTLRLSLLPLNLIPAIASVTVYAVLLWAVEAPRPEAIGVLVGCAIALNILFLAKQSAAVRENSALVAQRIEAESRAHYEERAREGQKLEAVGRLAGGIAHDFNNLLTTVLANSDFALSKVREGEAVQDELRDIHGAAVRGAELIRQLLAFSRKSVVAPVRLQPTLVVREMEGLLQRMAGERSRLLLELPADLGQITVDRGQLEQALANLVTNAGDAMPAGGAIVLSGANVELNPSDALVLELSAGPYVTLSVQDSGVGISPDIRLQIFEPFFTTKEPGKGTGLGLASTYGIMRQSGGAISVDSQPRRGAAFTLYFPKSAIDDPTAPSVIQPLFSASQRGSGQTILLVEDEAGVRDVTRRMLTADGFTVLTAADAVAARAMFDKHGHSIALMITDIMMPGDSGLVLAAGVRAAWPQLPVIFISGYSDMELPQVSGDKVLSDVVHKPFSRAELIARVHARLQPSSL